MPRYILYSISIHESITHIKTMYSKYLSNLYEFKMDFKVIEMPITVCVCMNFALIQKM